MVIEGEEVKAFVEVPASGATSTRVWAEKADGTPVLEASAGISSQADEATLLDKRLARLRPYERLIILEDLQLGMTGAVDELVRMESCQNMELYILFR